MDGDVSGAPAGHVLCLNAGSSSLKFALHALDEANSRTGDGAVTGVGGGEARLRLHDARGRVVCDRPVPVTDVTAAARVIVEALPMIEVGVPAAVGHRVVHGGATRDAPVRIDAAVRAELEALVPLAPLHQPAALAGIDAIATRFPDVPQVACFDTAFHRGMPLVAERLPLPVALWEAGIRRYGFHGLSYEWVVSSTPGVARGRAVVAHLGNGASMVALRDGRSIDTTMGFTPTGGLVMGSRSGDLDPGVLVHLLRQRGWDAAAVERLVEHEAGLRGVSGTTGDMATLLARRDRDPAAALAVELFCYHVRRHIGALAAVLGGLETLVFTGGIGEHAAAVRLEACRGLEHLGVVVDVARNADHAAVVSVPDAPCTVRVVRTDEERMIARHVRTVWGGGAKEQR